jgi:flavin reductase (DIM6/NTAB) family NADH-FMN oxidoreductase RutF
VFSSVVHIGSNPALVGFVNRPVDAAPHTISNIESTGVYTINHIHASMLEAAHQASAKYPAEVSEFEATGLTAQFCQNIAAPFVAESVVKYALSLRQIIPVTLNKTFFVIGEIIHIEIEDELVGTDGFLSIENAGSLASNGSDAYYQTSLFERYAYAKPGLAPRKLAKEAN